MRCSVLTQVERSRRPRRRRPLVVLVLAAVVGAGAYAGFQHFRGHEEPASAAPKPRPKPAAPRTPPPRRASLIARPKPLALLSTPRPPRHGIPAVAARSGILVDASTGAVLWQKWPHRRRPIASTTKIMTATLVLERLRLNRLVRVPRRITRIPLVREGLRGRERVQVWKLLDGLLIFSGNDDALTLAVAAGGSRRRFLSLMNEKARELGLGDTHFASTSGVIDKDNYSSAWDLAALTRYAMRDPRFRRIVATRVAHVPWSAPTYRKTYVNKNALLGLYRGADGVKTGWTTIAGHCLVASAHRHGVRLIAVLLHSADPYGDARRLLNFGFALPR
ncbi:MAG TPA: D-alanyl-D-alanine carboxypeptidase family protein [Gaiellaceae bacterium]|nr:D-alanyl-D-alanine carboxypeptidase family protein [Gaiellaceae bacterium]